MTDTIRYGIIGSGMMGGEHILDLNHIEGAEVVALADPVATSIDWGLGRVEAGLADALAGDKHVGPATWSTLRSPKRSEQAAPRR